MLKNLTYWFYFLGVLTASFDIFLTIDIGFTIRFAQIALLVPILIGFARACTHPINWPLGFLPLCVWSAFVLIFVPHTVLLSRSVGYALFLLFSLALVFSSVQLFSTEHRVMQLVRWEIYSATFVACFGVLQFIMPLLRFGAPLVQQWWFEPIIARVNGFSYEPSYFSTYLLLGFTTALHLKYFGFDGGISSRALNSCIAVIAVAMLLSSSRIGWMVAVVAVAPYAVPQVTLFGRQFFSSLLSLRLRKAHFAVLTCLSIIAVLAVSLARTYSTNLETLNFLLNGTGVGGGEGSHSVDTRVHYAGDVLAVFARSPLIGYSLGGIAPAIAQIEGSQVSSNEEAKAYEGINIFAEALAATGILGFVAFLYFLRDILWTPFQQAWKRRHKDSRWNVVLGLTWALVIELLALQFNQNILRLYLWIHIAVLCAAYEVARQQPTAKAHSA